LESNINVYKNTNVFLPIEFLNKNKIDYLTINIIERIFPPLKNMFLQRRASKIDRTGSKEAGSR
jgi:hypothetical protein